MNQEVSVAEQAAMETSEAPAAAQNVNDSDKTMLTVVYALFAAGFITGLTFIAGVIVAYVKRGEAGTAVAKDHYRWQIRTFWFSFLWSVIGVVLSMVVVGYFVLLANAIWTIYRIVKGWINLSSGKMMYS